MKQPKKRIMFAGPSGSGKTTLAKFISQDELGMFKIQYPFISGSVSDLLPYTKDEPHDQMLTHDKSDLYKQDYQILTLRKKLFSNQEIFVSDRSYLDSAAYFMYKQSSTIPQCEMEQFLELCKMCLCQHCDHLFLIDFTPYMIKNWVMEDNNKRILNKYFQAHIVSLMKFILQDWGVKLYNITTLSQGIFRSTLLENGGYSVGKLTTIYGSVDITVIHEPELSIREKILVRELYG